MNLASAIMKLASIGLTEEQARVVGDVVTEIQQQHEAAIEARRASDRDRKARERHRKSRDVTGQDVTSRKSEDADPRVRAFSVGEEVIGTSSLRSDASQGSAQVIFENASQELWAVGRELLIELGLTSSKAGTMIGRWLKETGDNSEGVLDVIRRAREHKPHDPVAWIVRGLPRPRAGPRAINGHVAPINLRKQALLDGIADDQSSSYDLSAR